MEAYRNGICPTCLSRVTLRVRKRHFTSKRSAPYVVKLLFVPSLPCIDFAVGKGKDREYHFSFNGVHRYFVNATSLRSRRGISSTSALIYTMVVPRILPGIRFRTNVIIFSMEYIVGDVTIMPFNEFGAANIRMITCQCLFSVLWVMVS